MERFVQAECRTRRVASHATALTWPGIPNQCIQGGKG